MAILHALPSAPRAHVAMSLPPPPPPALSQPLLIADAAVLLAYSLACSACRAVGMAAAEADAPGFDWRADLAGFDMHLTWQFISIEEASAASVAIAWALGGSLAGACDVDWLERDAADHARAPLGARGVLRGCAYAAPIGFALKALGAAAVILPVGGWLRLDAATGVADWGGLTLAVLLWRRWLLANFGRP